MTWRVVIPSARAENLARCVNSILEAHPALDPARIVAVDDGSRAAGVLPEITWVDGAKPFVYARNVNRGVAASAPHDTVIMGDDGELLTPGGFDLMAALLERRPGLAVLSAGIEGVVGNPRQHRDPAASFSEEERNLAFVCAMIPRRAWEALGPLDERFEGYGCDDVDFCWRARKAGWSLGVLHDCAVRHDGSIPSTFRTRPDVHGLFDRNWARLKAKWALP